MKIRSKQINGIIICLSVVSLYSIIAIKIFPSIRIPSAFSKDIMDAINDVIFDFSVAFLSGVIIYLLTAVVKGLIRRSQQKWLVYDSMNEIIGKIQPILEVCEVDKAPDLDVIIKSLQEVIADQDLYDEMINNIQSIRNIIRNNVLSSIIWFDYEADCLMDIDDNCAGIINALGNRYCPEKELIGVAKSIQGLDKSMNKLNNYANDRINLK